MKYCNNPVQICKKSKFNAAHQSKAFTGRQTSIVNTAAIIYNHECTTQCYNKLSLSLSAIVNFFASLAISWSKKVMRMFDWAFFKSSGLFS